MNPLEISAETPAPEPSARWRLQHSLWMGWLLTLGFGSFIAFLWIGGRTRQARWLLAGVAYSILPVLFFASGQNSTLQDFAGYGCLVIGVISALHAFRARPAYLGKRWREANLAASARTDSSATPSNSKVEALAGDDESTSTLIEPTEHVPATRHEARVVGRATRDGARQRYRAALDQLTIENALGDVFPVLRAERDTAAFGVSLNHLHRQAVERLSNQVLADDYLSEAERDRLETVMRELGVAPSADTMRRMIVAAANAGRLPTVDPGGLFLSPSERAHIRAPASLLDEVTRRTYRGGSSGVSVPIGLGIRVRSGSYRGRTIVTKSIEAVDRGTLTVTSARTVFVGRERTIELPHGKLVDVRAGRRELQMHVSNRRRAPLFKLNGDDVELVLAILNAAAAGSRR
jgi:hypothetical protein